VIIGFQIIIILPFTYQAVADITGFQYGGGTGWWDYLILSKFLGGDSERQYGSTYGNSIYWKFINEKTYLAPWFASTLKKGMIFVNLYYFFFR